MLESIIKERRIIMWPKKIAIRYSAVLLFFLLSLNSASVHATQSVQIQSVSYERAAGSHPITLRSCLNDYTVTTPHWNTSGKSEPIYFSKSEKIKLDAVFNLSQPYQGETILLKATGPNSLTIAQFQPSITNNATQFSVLDKETDQYAGQITGNTFNQTTLNLSWYYSVNGSTWTSAGSTSNSCYIILGEPWGPCTQTSEGDYLYVESLNLGLLFAAGQSTSANLLAHLLSGMHGWSRYTSYVDDYTDWTSDQTQDFYILWFFEDSTLDEGPYIQCDDYSNVIAILAGTTGCDSMYTMYVDYQGGGFNTHAIFPAGANEWGGTPPTDIYYWSLNQNCTSWNFHQINRTQTWNIGDGCLKLDEDTSDNNGFTSPGDLPQGDIYGPTYANRLSPDAITGTDLPGLYLTLVE